MTEAFPNAESTFQGVFNQPDPAPKLLELITAHLEVEAIIDLVLVYMELGKSPTQFNKFTAALVKLQSSTFKGDHCRQCFDRLGNPAQLEISSFMPFAINSMKFRPAALSGRVIPLQQISLLSAISIEYRLCDTHSAAVPHDLHHKPKCYP